MQGREYNHTQLRQKAQSLSAMRMRDHARRRLLAVLGVMVVLATASALMVPAVTMSASSTPLGALVSAGTPLSGYPAQSFSESVRNTAGDEVVAVQVDAPEGALPEGSTMKVALITDGQALDAAKEEAVAQSTMQADRARTVAVDIAFLDADGNEIEPLREVSVRMAAPAVARQSQLAVVHVDDQNNAAVVPEATVDAENEQVTFSADAFSVYALVYTVDFEYEVNGKVYGFTLNGQDAVSLRTLVDALHLPEARAEHEAEDETAGPDGGEGEAKANPEGESEDKAKAETNPEAEAASNPEAAANPEAASEAASSESAPAAAPIGAQAESASAAQAPTALADAPIEAEVTADDLAALNDQLQTTPEQLDAFMAAIESVEFTDESLLKVCAVEQDCTLFDLKSQYNFLQDYDIWKDEQWLHHFNAKQFEAGDWALVSLQAFSTQEALFITLRTGEQFAIKVTDAQAASMQADGVTVNTITNPSGTTIDLFDYWVFDDKKDADARMEWDRFKNPGTDGDGLDHNAFLRGTTGNNNGINASTSDTAHGHALKFNPAYARMVVEGTINNWGQETNDGWQQNTNDADWSKVTHGLNGYTLSGNPRQGIVQRTLDGGYPKLSGDGTLGATTESLAYLFDPSVDHAGKASYPGADKLLYVDEDGYYTYDSRSYKADFNKSTGEFTVSQQTETDTEKRGFWPFGTSKYWAGMHIGAQFSTPANGEVLNPQGVAKPMQFEFSGDDDTWIYIDGVLVGDGGGVHNRTGIDINFQTGAVHITGEDPLHNKVNENYNPNRNEGDLATGKYTNGVFEQQTTIFQMFRAAKGEQWASAQTTDDWKDVDGDGTFDAFADNTYHTFDMFYLERGGGESNLYVHYNLVSTADFTAHKALYDKTYTGDASEQPNILKRNQFTFDLIGLDGRYESTLNSATNSYEITAVEGGENTPAIKPRTTQSGPEVTTTPTTVALGDGETVDGWLHSTGVTEDGNVNFGFANISAEEMQRCADGHPSVYRYIVLEEIPENAQNAQGHTWGELKAAGNWAEMAQGGFTAVDPLTGGVITYGASSEGNASPVQFMAARVTRWEKKDSSGNVVHDVHGNVVWEYGLSKTYYNDADFWDKVDDQGNPVDNVASNKFIDIRNAWEPIQGDVEFLKADAAGTPLAGAQFTFYTDARCTNVATNIGANGVLSSGADGKVNLSSVKTGSTYYFKETQSPAGYDQNDTVYALNVKAHDDRQVYAEIYAYGDTTKADKSTIVNTKPGELTVVKQWVSATGQQVDGGDKTATVQLRRWHYAPQGAVSRNVSFTVKIQGRDDLTYTYTKNVSGGTITVDWWDTNVDIASLTVTDNAANSLEYTLSGYWDDTNHKNRKLSVEGSSENVNVVVVYPSDKGWLFNSEHTPWMKNVSVEGSGVSYGLEADTGFPAASDAAATQTLAAPNYAHIWKIGGSDSTYKRQGFDFPKTDANGKDYYYYLVEMKPNGSGGYTDLAIGDELHTGVTLKSIEYDRALEPTGNGKGVQQGLVTVVNEAPSALVSVTIKKTDDAKNSTNYLDGAQFKLEYRATDSDVWANAPSAAIEQLDADGVFTVPGSEAGITLTGLTDGQYRLTEVKAPAGYIIRTTAPVEFTVENGAITNSAATAADVTYTPADDEEDASFTIPNTPGKPLPSTGGPGTAPFAAVGALLVLAATGILLRTRRTH